MADTIKSFEDGIKRISEIVAMLEKGEVSLEEAAELYSEGVKLTTLCSSQLSAARLRISGLENTDNS